MTLDIQDEMVNKNKSLDATKVGQDVEVRLEQENAKVIEELRQVKVDLHEALSRKDEQVAKVMARLRLEHRKDMEQLRSAQEMIRISMEKLHEEKYSVLEKRLDSHMGQARPEPVHCEDSLNSSSSYKAKKSSPERVKKSSTSISNLVLKAAFKTETGAQDVAFSPGSLLAWRPFVDGRIRLLAPWTVSRHCYRWQPQNSQSQHSRYLCMGSEERLHTANPPT
jgi:hypothetical protein